ncbi:sugar ABC transporter ATP-binding protein [Nakamurella endophytica]|uniref:Monosaccharide-transporting ATPase n=1 Tax=Nakamurella endophytica TaxID=1748367 RepID=A0A917TCV8_9ACTN|nr:sugar ABC transporter ATP-binding protein [Nakamurella endophytica]GGM18911.1 monosaccharide-transporting ATPase [Nakamurella endophytica]
MALGAPAPWEVSMTPRLEVRGLSKAFLGAQALKDVSFSLEAGQVLALIGENGAGKSTLIRILSGAHGPDQGEILIDGNPVHIDGPGASEALGIATVYQELNLFPDLTVAENLVFNHFPGGTVINWNQARRESRAFLTELGLTLDVDRRVRQLSVAEKQMLEIAKALRRKAQLLILDEPTAVLGGADVDQLLDLVRGLRSHGVSIIFVSHRLEEVFGLADTYVVLKDGELTGTGRISDTDHDDLVSKMVGREFVRGVRSVNRELGAPVLEVEHLTRIGVLEDVSFTVRAGEVVGVAGLRGAGRTELARAIYGADPVTSGHVRLHGKPLDARNPIQAIGAGVGLVPEERKTQGLFTALSSVHNTALVGMVKRRRRWVNPSKDLAMTRDYIRRLRIKAPSALAPVAVLSGGNQQKVVLAKWLEAGVDLLILDEPTRGIDIGAKQEIYELIEELGRQGKALLIISSELPEVLALSHRVLVMYHGRIAAELDGDRTTEEEIMFHAVGGRTA